MWRNLAGRGLCAGLLMSAIMVLQGCHSDHGSYESRFLAAWSPDGSRTALVSNLLDDGEKESGLWLLDVKSGDVRQIYRAPEGYYCIHPQWSPYSSELLFGLLQRDGPDSDDERLQLSVLIVGEDGTGLRKAAETELPEKSALWPNRISWGPVPATILIEEPADAEHSTAVLVDLRNGLKQQFLPGNADSWTWEASPSGRQIAALLFNEKEETAEVYVSDHPLAGWRRISSIRIAPGGDPREAPMISWSPDSSSFVVCEMDDRRPQIKNERSWLNLFDASTGRSRQIAEGRPNGPICWNTDGSRLLFGGDGPGGQTGVFLVDLIAGTEPCVLPGPDLHPLAWDRLGGTISYFRQPDREHSSIEPGTLDSCFASAADDRFSEVTARLLQGDVEWSVSPGGAHALFFGDSIPVVALDLPCGPRRIPLVLTPHQRF